MNSQGHMNNQNKSRPNHKKQNNTKGTKNINKYEIGSSGDKVKVKIPSVLFVPHTPNSELAKALRDKMTEMGNMFGWNYKIVERAGATLASRLVRSNPWANSKGGRGECIPCLVSSKGLNCTWRNLVYEILCKKCDEGVGGCKFVYVGETSRTVCERFHEHHTDYGKRLETSHMAKHSSLAHGLDSVQPEFDVRIVKFFKTAIERQVYEAIRISSRASEPGINVMNSKSEFNRCTLPRIVMFCGEKPNEMDGGACNSMNDRVSNEGGRGEGDLFPLTHQNKRKIQNNKLKWGEVGPESAGVATLTEGVVCVEGVYCDECGTIGFDGGICVLKTLSVVLT